MRKILISFLLVAVLAIFGLMVIKGITIGQISIGYSLESIIAKNNELDTSIASLKTRIDKEYTQARSNLDLSFDKLQHEKQNYQNTIAYTSQEEINSANTSEEYKLDYLWTNIGLYATKNNLNLKADLSHGSSGVNNQYNISFTVIGEYLPISEFIYAIENDSSLGFRIEEFTIIPNSDEEENLQATFIIKNVTIDPTSLSTSSTVKNGTVTNRNPVSDVSNDQTEPAGTSIPELQNQLKDDQGEQ